MKKYKYVVLQDINADKRDTSRRGRNFGPATTQTVTDPSLPPDITVNTTEMTPAQASDELRNPNTLDIARNIPLKLIDPWTGLLEEQGDANADGVTWGIEAVGADSSQIGASDVTVAVLDTGIDSSHPAFSRPELEIVEMNFTNDPDGDSDGHGTHLSLIHISEPTRPY